MSTWPISMTYAIEICSLGSICGIRRYLLTAVSKSEMMYLVYHHRWQGQAKPVLALIGSSNIVGLWTCAIPDLAGAKVATRGLLNNNNTVRIAWRRGACSAILTQCEECATKHKRICLSLIHFPWVHRCLLFTRQPPTPQGSSLVRFGPCENAEKVSHSRT